MKGLPKVYNTKEDVFNALEYDRVGAVAQLQGIYDNRFIIEKVKTLEIGETLQTVNGQKSVVMSGADYIDGYELQNGEFVLDGKVCSVSAQVNDTAFVGESEQDGQAVFQTVEDPNAYLFRLGFTTAELAEIGIHA